MKKIAKNFFVLAVGALVAVSMTSCHSKHEAAPAPAVKVTSVDIATTTPKTLIVTVSENLPLGATLKYNGATATSISGRIYTFENVADGKNVVLTGGSVIDQNVKVDFAGKTLVAIDLTVRTLNDGVTISGGSDASTSDTYLSAQSNVTIPAALTPALNNKKLALTLYSKVAPLQKVVEGKTYAPASLSLDCKPDGATFNPAVEVVTDLPGAENTDVFVQNAAGTEKPECTFSGTKLTAKMPHFSVWDIIMNVKVTKVTASTEDLSTGSLISGRNKISYAEKAGFETRETGIIKTTISSLFGSELKSSNKSIEYDMTGTGTYRVYQDVQVVEMLSGQRTFSFKLYGAIHMDVTSDPAQTEPTKPVVPTHSGGSND
jgi:hypothetical protein